MSTREVYIKLGLPILAVIYLVSWLIIGLTPLNALYGTIGGALLGMLFAGGRDDDAEKHHP